MPRLFVALPVPEEIADALAELQSGVPDARWQTMENLHVTLCFCDEVPGAVMRDLEEELGDIAGPRFSLKLAGVEQFSTGKQPRALVALVEKSDQLDWLQQKVATVARNCGIEIERRKFRPHVTLARFPTGAETGHGMGAAFVTQPLRRGEHGRCRFGIMGGADHIAEGVENEQTGAFPYRRRNVARANGGGETSQGFSDRNHREVSCQGPCMGP